MSKHVLLDSSRSRILAYFPLKKSIYAYNVTTESWECLNDNYDDWSRGSVIVDGVIYRLVFDEDYYYTYSVKVCFLRAYDVDEKRELFVKCKKSEEIYATRDPDSKLPRSIPLEVSCWECVSP
ncbi:hypothetical protein DITRI_Ditri02bG0090100 [Diplodiscus trichospermus]